MKAGEALKCPHFFQIQGVSITISSEGYETEPVLVADILKEVSIIAINKG